MKFDGVDLEFDLGILEPLLVDESIATIMVNGTNPIYVSKNDAMVKTDIRFDSEEHVLDVARNIVEPMGRWIDEDAPLVDARLPDGTRVNVVIRPIALTGPTITLHKFPKEIPDWETLIQFGSVNQTVVDLLEMCVRGKLNIMVAGGSDAGKTTIANLLSIFFEETERIVTIETTAELRLRHEHVVVLETRAPDKSGKGEVNMDDLFVNSVRMMPDRIVAGEIRSGEAWSMIQAMKSGFEGNMFTIHGNSPLDALQRLESMAMMSGTSAPLLSIRERIASVIDVIVHIMRLPDGKRKITYISEVVGVTNNVTEIQHIGEFVQEGWENNEIVGEFRMTGYVPQFVQRLKAANIDIPTGFFDMP